MERELLRVPTMEIVFIACLATLGVCALLAVFNRGSQPVKPKRDPLDSAVMKLIEEVTREPGRRVNPSKRQTWV